MSVCCLYIDEVEDDSEDEVASKPAPKKTEEKGSRFAKAVVSRYILDIINNNELVPICGLDLIL